ncbi:2-methylcitrate dehydratase PrpD [Xylaria sp. CBS 124048]|nr:2-methylcitrate dehydratase PrpD [Xylaria sp. CBS 124048]
MATLQLATWATNLKYEDLPASVVEAAVKSFYNWAGCAIGGSAQDAPKIARETMQSFSGGPTTSSILGADGSEKLADAQLAAFVNGISSHVDDYDDTHLDSLIHPSGPVASALLAVAEWTRPVTGHEFITAFVAGVEAECKLGLAVTPDHYTTGWHITSTAGSIGAAVAVGRLLRLDITQMQHAIGVASTQVVGMQEHFGSMTKSFHVGRAAQGGMLAALLAQNQFTSSLQSLEAERGWLHVVSARENASALFDQLGKTWEIEKNSFKPFPCGVVLHPLIDAAIQIHRDMAREGIDFSSAKRVSLQVNSKVLVLTGKTDPTTGLEGKFSLYHAVAVGLLYGEATPTYFTDDAVLDPTTVEFRKKINVTVDDDHFSKSQTEMTVDVDDKTSFYVHVKNALGSLDNPLTDAHMKTKFLDQVSKRLGEARAENAFAAFTNIANMTDVGTLGTLY